MFDFEQVPPIILVALGGMLGAIARFLITDYFKEFKPIPFGTLLVNVSGSFLLGIIVTLFRLQYLDTTWILFGGIGFFGSFTTMSSFAVETINLTEDELVFAILNFALMISLVIIGAYLGKILALFFYKRGLNI